MLPPYIDQYLEAFGGSGSSILALKPQSGRLDIYNDLNNDLVNVLFCIKEKLLVLSKELRFLPVHGRTAFAHYRNIAAHEQEFYSNIEQEVEILKDPAYFTAAQVQEMLPIFQERAKLFDVHRAAAFLLVMYGSFSGTGTSFGVKTVDVNAIIQRLPEVSERLQSIVLENKNAFELMAERDRPNGLIYADPPYYEAEKCYDVSFSTENHVRLRDQLRASSSYVIVSYNDCPTICELYREDFFIFTLKRNNPLSQKKGSTYGELFITNYDPRPFMNDQINLFAPEPQAKGELVLVNTPHKTLKTFLGGK
jgi:DNA adenine methylase